MKVKVCRGCSDRCLATAFVVAGEYPLRVQTSRRTDDGLGAGGKARRVGSFEFAKWRQLFDCM